MQVPTHLIQSCVSECDLGQYGNSFTSLYSESMGCDRELEAVYLLADLSGSVSGALSIRQHVFCHVGGHWQGLSPHLTSDKTDHVTAELQGHKTDEMVRIPSQ